MIRGSNIALQPSRRILNSDSILESSSSLEDLAKTLKNSGRQMRGGE